MQPKKAICHKFEEAVEGTRAQTEAFWESLSLPRHKSTNRKPKPDKKGKGKGNIAGLAKSYSEVDKRDERRCQHPSCYSTNTNHHHCLLKSSGGRNDVENLVTLCLHHHTLGKESPHQSIAWRRYWEGWAEERYPKYWSRIREEQKITPQYSHNTAIGG